MVEPTTLCEWKEEEEEFKAKVVDMRQHNGLANPYEAKHDTCGESGASDVSSD